MNFNAIKLSDFDPVLCNKLRNYCYDLNGYCQQVHSEMGPFLNEYMYQQALKILFDENDVPFIKEYYFQVHFHGRLIEHKHYVDFFVRDKVLIECKAIEQLGPDQRQQLWNYMRLTGTPLGILINFAPVRYQCEHYYLDTENQQMYMF